MVISKDSFVILDPAVELVDTKLGTTSFFCHTALQIGMAVPDGEGLLDFVESLRGVPAKVAAIYEDYDSPSLVDEMLASLAKWGFAHVSATSDPPSEASWPSLRTAALDASGTTQRQQVVMALDAATAVDDVLAEWKKAGDNPEVTLLTARLSAHATVLKELSTRRASGELRAHHVLVRTHDAVCDPATLQSLVSLGAFVQVDDVAWPAPAGHIPGLEELARHRIPVHVSTTPDATILDRAVQARAIDWLRKNFVSGLVLLLDAHTLFGSAEPTAEMFKSVLQAVRSMENEHGDIVVGNMASDEVILGNTRCRATDEVSPAQQRFRRAHLHWRAPILKSYEGTCLWSQLPHLEDKWIREAEDLLPNHPELLRLEPGSRLLDLCGGMGRVARRLAPAVGREGLVISMELRRFLTERARRFVCERGISNIQFRPGLAQYVPLPDSSMDAAVNEWTGEIWESGLGPAMVSEMARVVRPGGRIAVTHRLTQLRLNSLGRPWVQYAQIYEWVCAAFRNPNLKVIGERVWGQRVPSLEGESELLWVEQYLPRLINPNAGTLPMDASGQSSLLADVYLTVIAERL